jgi:hypothetical protein
MKRRGLRATLTAGALSLAVAAGVVAFNWGVVRDHVEGWWFQATRDTKTIAPGETPVARPGAESTASPNVVSAEWQFQRLANQSGYPVLFDPAAVVFRIACESLVDYRIVEQRFPRRAYVVVGYPSVELGYGGGVPDGRPPFPEVLRSGRPRRVEGRGSHGPSSRQRSPPKL